MWKKLWPFKKKEIPQVEPDFIEELSTNELVTIPIVLNKDGSIHLDIQFTDDALDKQYTDMIAMFLHMFSTGYIPDEIASRIAQICVEHPSLEIKELIKNIVISWKGIVDKITMMESLANHEVAVEPLKTFGLSRFNLEQ